MQKAKIDFLKFKGAKQFKSKDGTDFIAIPIVENKIFEGKKGLYLGLTIHDNKNGKDDFDNDGFIAVEVSKEEREAGEKGAIIGNWKHVGNAPRKENNAPRNKGETPKHDGLDDDPIPF